MSLGAWHPGKKSTHSPGKMVLPLLSVPQAPVVVQTKALPSRCCLSTLLEEVPWVEAIKDRMGLSNTRLWGFRPQTPPSASDQRWPAYQSIRSRLASGSTEEVASDCGIPDI